ncbi:MAG: hypothetical protein KC800_21685, partial [Candidatus Eremiobacteraeota bacterium]|nr:hypothetical protein [Candidatus Eremiobacteraeota bacterium]
MSSNSATRVLKAFQWADSQVARAEAKKDQGDAELAERQAEEKKALANSILDKFDENFELLSGLDGQRKSSLDRDKDSRPGAVWNDKFGILNVDGGTVNMSTFGEFRDERGPSGRR